MFHVTVLSVASLGDMLAIKEIDLPTSIEAVSLIVTPVTATLDCSGDTLTLNVVVFPL